MAVKVRIEVDRKAVQRYLVEETRQDIERRGKAIAAAAGLGMNFRMQNGVYRSRGTVWTGTYEARRAEAHGRALLRAIDAGR